MSERQSSDGDRSLAEELRLRPHRLRVTRISRKVLIGVGTVASVSVLGLTYWALGSHGLKPDNQNLYNTQNQNVADGVASLPSNYGDLPKPVPQLGPPLPGDLGPPILHAEQGSNAPAETDAANQQLMQEQDSARTSSLFVQTATGSATLQEGQPDSIMPGQSGDETSDQAVGSSSGQNMQDQKLAFLNGPVDALAVSSERLTPPASLYIIQAGTVIPAALITGIESDLPGLITAQVTESVYDSSTGQYLLIPQGARLIGEYNSEVAYDQARVQLIWTRLIMPNGQSIMLDNQPGADTQGYSGLQDSVNNHWGAIFKAALVSTLLSVGAEAGTSDQENNLIQAIRGGAADSVNQAGQQIVERELDIQPTLTVRPGFPLRVIVNQDFVLKPYNE